MRFGAGMTWSLYHTISGATAQNTVMNFMFDTYLPATEWTVAAHPSASATKRILNRTKNSILHAQPAWKLYYWADWGTANLLKMYNDYTYTTTPGDLATVTTQTVSYALNPNVADWKFWTSSANSTAQLITRGKHIIWFDAGVTEVHASYDASWNGSTFNASTALFPTHYSWSSFAIHCSLPGQTASSTASSRLNPVIGTGSNFGSPVEDIIYKGFPVGYNTSGATIVVPQMYAFYVPGDDIALHRSSTMANTNGDIGLGPGTTILYEGEYWLRCSGDMSKNGYMLNFGATEPDFT